MSIFSASIVKLVNDYKRLLRRYLPNSEREKAIINLGIKRKSLRFDNDVILYNKAHRILNDIEYWTEKTKRTAAEYSGVDEFYQHLKDCLSNYRVENSVVVHANQKASCALVQAIQLISSSEADSSDTNASKLNDCILTVEKFGTPEERKMLAKALYDQNISRNCSARC